MAGTLYDTGAAVGDIHVVHNCVCRHVRCLLDVRISMIAVVICYWGIGLSVTFVLIEFFDGDAEEALKTVNIALGIGTATMVARLWFLLGRSPQ